MTCRRDTRHLCRLRTLTGEVTPQAQNMARQSRSAEYPNTTYGLLRNPLPGSISIQSRRHGDAPSTADPTEYDLATFAMSSVSAVPTEVTADHTPYAESPRRFRWCTPPRPGPPRQPSVQVQMRPDSHLAQQHQCTSVPADVRST